MVELRAATVRQEDRVILKNVTFRQSPGEFTYLIGRTGSGKSSLLKTLYGALPLREGQGKVAGFDLTRLNRRNIPLLRRQLGIVFQDFNLLNDRNVGDNLDFVLRATGWKNKSKRTKRIDQLLEEVGMKGSQRRMPHQLSGGEQQRVVIARALLNQPGLILADEPTGNLDPETSDSILMLLRQLAQQHDTAVLLATHDYRILEQFPARILRCVHERIIDQESFELRQRTPPR